MNPWPLDRSVLIMDNCAIHKSDALRAAVEVKGCRLVFLPPYSPDFNPIEESFSSCMYDISLMYLVLKAYTNLCD